MLTAFRKYISCQLKQELNFTPDFSISKKFTSNCKFMVYTGCETHNYTCFITNGNTLTVRNNKLIEESQAPEIMAAMYNRVKSIISYYHNASDEWQGFRENLEDFKNAFSLDWNTRTYIYLGLQERLNISPKTFNEMIDVLDALVDTGHQWFVVGENVVDEPVFEGETTDDNCDIRMEIANEYHNMPTENWKFESGY